MINFTGLLKRLESLLTKMYRTFLLNYIIRIFKECLITTTKIKMVRLITRNSQQCFVVTLKIQLDPKKVIVHLRKKLQLQLKKLRPQLL
jgi:hypothetical protein